MAKFKINQKVVFVGGHPSDPECIDPKMNETVTISECFSYKGTPFYSLKEYPLTIIGGQQMFHEIELRPISYQGNASSEILEKFKPTTEKVDVPIKETVLI